jgi:hypothetical protein
MKKILLLTLVTCFGWLGNQAIAQRYLTEIFTSVDVTSDVVYGENYSVLTGSPLLQNLVMDVYEPTGDTETARPVMIYIPTGSFLPRYINQLPTGDKTDSASIEMCKRFARMGYVVACIDYRRGWNPQGTQDERTQTIIQAVYRSMQDGKTAIRWFRKDAAENGNTYAIDDSRIVVGGQGSGGYTSLAIGHINELAEMQLTKFFNFTTNAFMVDTAIMGDWDGFGGLAGVNQNNHPGYSSDVNCTYNIGGAIGDSTWIDAGEPPVISIHGINDAFAPYGYGIVNVPGTTLFVVDVSGSSDVIRIANDFGNNDILHSAPVLADPYSLRANAVNAAYDGTFGNAGNEGLFGIEGNADGNGPWEFWDDATVSAGATALGQDPATILANGYASNPMYQALGPVAGKARAMAFLDTIQFYVAPRLYRVLYEFTGVDEQAGFNASVSVFPNPSNGNVNIVSEDANNMIGFQVYDATGKMIKNENNVTAQRHVIGAGELSAGFYLVNIMFENGIVTKKLVIR